MPVYSPLPGERDAEDPEPISWWGLCGIAKPEAPLIIAGCVLTVIRVPFSLMVPHYAAMATGALFKHNAAKAHRAVVALIYCGFADLVISNFGSIVFSLAQQRVIRRVRNELFENLLRQETAFHDGIPSGALASRLEVDTAQMAADITWVFSSILDSSARVVGITVYMWIFSPELAAITFAAIPNHLASANDVSSEVFGQASTVTGSGTQQFEGQRYSRETDKVYSASVDRAKG
eukprot:gene6299-4034_t